MKPPVPPPAVVWDLGIRVFHWMLVATVAALALTGFGIVPLALALHLAAGYVLMALLLFRLVWGFTGSTFSRFRSFLFGPRAVLRHLCDMAAGEAGDEAGHNPLGAQMVFVLLFVLAALVATGVVTLGGTDKQGPLAFVTTFATGETARRLHKLFAIGLVGLIALHVLGVVFESLRTRHNLVAAMWSGHGKRSGAPPLIQGPHYRRAALAIALISAAAAAAWFALAARPGLSVPREPLLAQYRESCGDCHAPHHPSLASAATWGAIMGGLDRHFGEDASLPDDAAKILSAYLAQHAAETADTKAARRIGAATSPETMRISATGYWRKRHRALPPALLRSRKVGSAANCAACHMDADSGQFKPQSISIPKETEQ